MVLEILYHLIAAGTGALVAFLWVSFIYPAIIEGFFEPTKLAAEYRGILDFGKGPHHAISLRVRKHGYRVTGILEFVKGRHLGKKYPVKGRYSHSLLTFLYFPADKLSTSQGAASFQRLKDGDLFSGHFAYYSQESDSVSTVQCSLTPLGKPLPSRARRSAGRPKPAPSPAKPRRASQAEDDASPN